MEEDIIQPISKDLLKSELTPDRCLRTTNKSHNEIYVIRAAEAPHVMQEIGRLREIAFRTAGGGTGKSMDIDEFDTMPHGCKQLIVWNPEAEEIIGGYRYLFGEDWQLKPDGQPNLAMSHMFHFTDEFMKDYAPYTGARPFFRVVGISECKEEHKEYLCARQPVGRLRRTHSYQPSL